jgi:leucyl-tRNA synthetase
LGAEDTLAYEPWPEYDPELAKLETITIAVQVNGKLRETIEVDAEISKEDLLAAAKEQPKVQSYLEGKEIKREIVVPKRLVNLVVG